MRELTPAQRHAQEAAFQAAVARFQKNPRLIEARIKQQREWFQQFCANGVVRTPNDEAKLRRQLIAAEMEHANRRLEARDAR